jgi:hypothetical protein
MESNKEVVPYAPSWVNKTIDWIRSLRYPSWLVYLGMYVLGVAYIAFSLLAESKEYLFANYEIALLNAIWIPFPLASIHYLNRFAEEAIDKFHSEMDCSSDELALIKYRMVTIPRSVALFIPLVVGILIYADAFLGNSIIAGNLQSPWALAIAPLYPVVGISFTPLFIYLTIRQLYLVNYMFSLVRDINIFNLQPLYVPSTLTARLGIIWILYLNANLLTSGAAAGISPSLSFVLAIAQILFAMAAFIVPLLGIRRKIVEHKVHLIGKNARLLEKEYKKLQDAIDVDDYGAVDEINRSVEAIMVFRAELDKTPTWPWRQETIRGFLSAVLLPIFIWLVQRLLSQFL